MLPPAIALQYRPIATEDLSPAIGAGINGIIFFEAHDRNGVEVESDNGVRYALQAGGDSGISGPWGTSIEVKKVFFNTNAEINGVALRSSVDLDP